MDEGETKETERLTSTAACDFRQSQAQDEILRYPERERSRKFGKWCRERKLETSAPLVGRGCRQRKVSTSTLSKAMDSILLSRVPSSSGVNVETMVG
jgi:hypothetical protein